MDRFAAASDRVRRIFMIVVDRGVELAIYTDAPVSTPLRDVLAAAFDAMLDDDGDLPRRLIGAGDYVAYDDSPTRLPDDVRIGSIPTPGLVYVIPRSATSLADLGLAERDDDADDESGDLDVFLARELAYHRVRLDETWGPRLERFLTGPDAAFEPDPLPVYDAFISFTSPDFLVASELTLQLQARDVRCFLANTTISAGSLWNDEIRLALHASRRFVLVASGHVARSSWVMSEVGAAWVLGLPIVVVPTGDAPWSPDDLLVGEMSVVGGPDDIDTLVEMCAAAVVA